MLAGVSDSRVITVAQAKAMVRIYASVSDYGPTPISYTTAERGADVVQQSQETVVQETAMHTEPRERPQPIPLGIAAQPVTIHQRSSPKKTNPDPVQKQRRRTDSGSSEMEGSVARTDSGSSEMEGYVARTATNAEEGQKGEKIQKERKDKRGEKDKHVMQQHNMGLASQRLPPKPIKKTTPIITQGPFSRQWLRGEASRGRLNTSSAKKVARMPPKQPSFKKPLQTSTKPRPKNRGSSAAAQTEDLALAQLNQEGFYEVTVEYSHASILAQGCGVSDEAVSQALIADNQQRKEEMERTRDMEVEDEGPDVTFDPDLEDDLESSEDLE